MSDWYLSQLARQDQYGETPPANWPEVYGGLTPDERGLQPQTATIGPAEMRSYTPTLGERIKGGLSDLFRSGGADPYNAGKLGDIATTGLSMFPPIGIPVAKSEMEHGVTAQSPSGVVMGALGAIPGAKAGVLGEIAKPFYSAAGRAVENAKLGKGTGEQWLGYLRNQPGVKPEELNYVFGNLPEGQLTKAQMQAHAAENAVQLGETRKGYPASLAERERLADEHQAAVEAAYPYKQMIEDAKARNAPQSEIQRLYDQSNAAWDHAQEVGQRLNKATEIGSPTKYEQWQLPGGENYRETLLTLPEKAPHIPTGRYVVSDGSNFNMAANTLEEAKQIEASMLPHSNRPLTIKEEMRPDKSASFHSTNWDEPNVLAHVRTNDREIPGVGKSLHVEEIQSDWHQKGRTSGYSKEEPHWVAYYNSPKGPVDVGHGTSKQAAVNDAGGWSELVRIEYRQEPSRMTPGVPDAPFKSTWADVALKRQIREASEKGYDAISWTPGEAQAARYDLSKHVDSVHYNPETQRLVAKKDNANIIDKNSVKPEMLADIIGKEAAENIMKAEPNVNGLRSLSGEGLKVGGEGMRAFYDKMLVDKANAIGKKHGARVEQSELPKKTPATMDEIAKELGYGGWHSGMTAEQRAHVNQIFDSKQMPGDPVHVLRITPELRAAAMKGFPLFTAGGIVAGGTISELARQDNYGQNE